MAKNPLFSAYRQGENRVTSSMLAVFERIDLSLLERILAASTEESSLEMLSFTNQPPGKGHSVPDAKISARFAYWFETKTKRNSVGEQQLREHLVNLDSEGTTERLFVVTPDPQQPEVISTLGDPRVVWFNFQSLYDAVEEVVTDQTGLVSEQARFLLHELQALLVNDGLVDSDDVVIVAARFAYPEYLKRSVYICQAGRTFRDGLTHLGFYAESAIQTHVPCIRYREQMVKFTHAEASVRKTSTETDQLVAEVIETELAEGIRKEGNQHQIFLLSAPDDPATLSLAQPIQNDTTASDRPFAWTMGQRYVSLGALTRAGVKVTSDLTRRSH